MRVLVVEDEPRLVEQLERELSTAGYAVDTSTHGADAALLAAVHAYDAIVLDLGLPDEDGLSVLRRWRSAGVVSPVLVLTARGSWHDKVVGIDAGADDYLAKPFQVEELLARLRALIRRASGLAEAVLRCGSVSLDTRSGRVSVSGSPVELTGHEYRVLAYLMHRRGRIVSRAELSEHVYAEDADRDSNTIEVFVGRVRKKLGVNLIATLRGLGYRLEEPS